VIVDVGFYRDELNTYISNVDLTNGQQHVVSVRRYNRGRKLVIQVDDYTPAVKEWTLTANTDTRLDNPKYIYFGRNGSFHHSSLFYNTLLNLTRVDLKAFIVIIFTSAYTVTATYKRAGRNVIYLDFYW